MQTKTWTLVLLAIIAATLVIDLASGTADAVTGNSDANLPLGSFSAEMGVARQQETAVVAVINNETGQVRSCWFSGPSTKPRCSVWSD
ncbi:MAG: hypothetical protein MI920_14030 [Kiloniellales bacterium]|nr:hypothetical protein [Kiloniellales bacterium]